MAPLSTARRKEACELVIIAKCDGINTLASKELRLIKRYMQEIGVESLEEAYKQALVEKKTPEDQQKPREAKENNLNKRYSSNHLAVHNLRNCLKTGPKDHLRNLLIHYVTKILLTNVKLIQIVWLCLKKVLQGIQHLIRLCA